MRRVEDWPMQLSEFFASRQNIAWLYGAHDCCMFACDAIYQMTGVDPADELRGYLGKEQAQAILDQYGGVAGVAERQMRRNGGPEIAPRTAGRGDVALVNGGNGDTLGIVDTTHVIIAAKPGHAQVERSVMKRAWRI